MAYTSFVCMWERAALLAVKHHTQVCKLGIIILRLLLASSRASYLCCHYVIDLYLVLLYLGWRHAANAAGDQAPHAGMNSICMKSTYYSTTITVRCPPPMVFNPIFSIMLTSFVYICDGRQHCWRSSTTRRYEKYIS